MEISSSIVTDYYSVSLLLLFTALLVPFLVLGKRNKTYHLPPGPSGWPILGNLVQISNQTLQVYFQKLHQQYGSIYTVRLGYQPLIMVASHELAHEALIEKSSIFASRPPAQGLSKLFSSNQTNINTAAYGPLWRTLRRNLVSETLNPAALNSFRKGRERTVNLLIDALRTEAGQNEGAVKVMDHLRRAVFNILVFMCFGIRLEEEAVTAVQNVTRELILSGGGLPLDAIYPKLRVFYRKRWKRMQGIRQRQVETFLPLINERRAALAEGRAEDCRAYVDSLLSLTIDGGRKLNDGELVTLCFEFINAGTDTTSTTLQWALANLVIHQEIQAKLYGEILDVAGKERRRVGEEDVQKMGYLEAVVKETLRRHPPGKLVLTHAVTEECRLGGFDVPAGAWVNFSVWDMGNDPKVWENPLQFLPERFLNAEVDMTGSKEIKMMPFGVGRRICPALGLAMLHLQLILGRLVQTFAWESKGGEPVDVAEKPEFTMVMKNPLQAVLKERD
uniref:TSA: Wollemia nobilis Ref_Wollemi_Transcript_14117_1818 transcribed RNA sequence n=1 Tax=Wollemia nobilis TaxID=56998 RepID=A0A0C9RJY0_9CONI